ncbi:MAG: NHL repeat-containing protein [Bacteroidota bacterium]|nr:NHL repeat-containing protein [Bacteroidota bacterium]
MRPFFSFIASLLLAPALFAQSSGVTSGWIVDDFNPGDLSSQWIQTTGKWSVGERGATVVGSTGDLILLNRQYLMRTKPYTVEATFVGAGGGVIFCAERTDGAANAHVTYLSGNTVSTGYMDFHGKYVETRVVDFLLPAGPVTLRVFVDPLRRSYSVFVGEQSIALEELRFVSGYSGLFARAAGPKFDAFQVLGEGVVDRPSFYRKSNDRQLDHLSYMAILDDALYISNPVIGIVQRLTSIGTYANEYRLEGENPCPRGLFIDEDRTLYVADGGAKNVRVFDREGKAVRTLSEEIRDPRGVACAGGSVYVLDADGIKVFDKKGAFVGHKAAGMFKDPKNISYANGSLYIADFGNARVQVLDARDFSVKRSITESLVSPWDAATDPATNEVYVADPGAGVVFHYSPDGTLIERIDPMTIKGFISPRCVRVRGPMIYVADFERILGFRKGVLTIRPALRIE